jgi:hypothetical protein
LPVFSSSLQPHEIDVGACLGLLGEEGSFSGADLELQRVVVSEQERSVDWLGKLIDFETNRLDD